MMTLRKMHLVPAILLAVVILAACQGKGNLSPLKDLAAGDDTEETYVVKPGDVLMVKVWGEPKLSHEVYVRDDGKFSFELIKEVQAAGKTLPVISDEIKERLAEFVPAASVSISVVQSAPIRYYLSGAFLKPGEYLGTGRMTLLQAVATGGGFAPFADESNVTLIRRINNQELRYRLDYNRVIEGAEPNPVLKNGDIIAVN